MKRDLKPFHRREIEGLHAVRLLWFLLLSTLVVAASEWQPPAHTLLPRPDGPGLDSLGATPPPEAFLSPGPKSSAASQAWRNALDAWREQRKKELGDWTALYQRPDLAWTRRIFNQDQLIVWDRSFYDPVRRTYTVDRALAGIESRFGKLDSVLIWPGYPHVGLDDRNQFDLLRDLPGGVAGLRHAVEEFHRQGVRVFFPVIAWDQGTRDEGAPRAEVLARLLLELGADGVNLDTLNQVPDDFRTAGDKLEPHLAFEPQFDTQNGSLAASAISWNDWVVWESFHYPFVPMVSQVKWLESRHAVEVTDRSTRVKIDSLQHAFFNGQGYVMAENLWGFWAGFSARDAEAVKRFTRIERPYADLLTSPDWEPHVPTLQPGIFASRFPLAGRTLWTLVNRNEFDVVGEQLALPKHAGARYYDLWHGREVKPSVRDATAYLDFAVEGLGFGAILTTGPGGPDPELAALLAEASRNAKSPLSSYSQACPVAAQTMVPIALTTPAKAAPPGMVALPAADYDFIVSGIEIENGNDPGVDVQFPWETSPRRFHRHQMKIPPLFIDRTPVTNAGFKRFLDATHYHPDDDHNFLRDWKDGAYPVGAANKPVTWVSLEDARAYAAWAGKRLPHVWEWQYAAQGTDGRAYPWGPVWNTSAVPPPDHSRQRRLPTDVDAYPAGASPFGVLDMEGNVAQWTDEFIDEHTRAAVLRGGDYYRPLGSLWYFPKSYRLDEQNKYLLMAPGRDRSGVVGFRCVRDAVP